MVSKFLALPYDIKFKIVQHLVPLLTDARKFPPNYQTLNDDVLSVFECIPTVQRLAGTCKDLRLFCAELLFRAVKLKFNPRRVLMKEDGSIDRFCAHTAFLSLDGDSHDSEDMRIDEDVMNGQSFTQEQLNAVRSRPIIRSRLKIFPLDVSIARTFRRFRSIVALELEDFPLSVANLMALSNLGSLRTLSLRCPNTSYGYIPNVTQIHNVCVLPKVTNLGFCVVNSTEAVPLSNIAKLFERSIKTLSIEGQEYDTVTDDYIRRLLFPSIHPVTLPNLEQLNVDFLEFTLQSLRRIVQTSPNLQSLTVDCRGAEGFMPFFYMIDLMRMIGREPFDRFAVEWYDNHEDTDYDPRGRGTHMWKARVSRFICAFTTLHTAYGQQKVLDTAEVYLAESDELSNNVTGNLRFTEVLQVFRESKSTFRALRSLVFGTANDDLFEPNESREELKHMTIALCRDCLPSASDVKIRWGNMEAFRCSLGQIYDTGCNEIWRF